MKTINTSNSTVVCIYLLYMQARRGGLLTIHTTHFTLGCFSRVQKRGADVRGTRFVTVSYSSCWHSRYNMYLKCMIIKL